MTDISEDHYQETAAKERENVYCQTNIRYFVKC